MGSLFWRAIACVSLICGSAQSFGGPNVAPTVSLTSPTNGQTFNAPAQITLSATASDSDGSIAKVDFFRGGTVLIGTVTTAPYTLTWSNVAAGAYSITARATDNKGATKTSTAASITVAAQQSNQPPVVTLTSPQSGASLAAPANILLSATASDTDGSISRVEFFNGTSTLASLTSPPWSYNWNGVGAGTYSVSARATDNAGAATISAAAVVTVSAMPANEPPMVALVDASCSFYTTASAITLRADAIDPDGHVAQVQFYAGPNLIASVNGSAFIEQRNAYSHVWGGMAAGTYSITARALDNNGNSVASAPMTVTVHPHNEAPTVGITSPANWSIFAAGAPVTINANAADADGSIARVDFYAGATLVGSPTTAPYTATWTNSTAGSYTLTAVAYDDKGASTASTSVFVTIQANSPPTVALTAPQAQAAYVLPTTVRMAATASDANGSVARVDFFQGSTLLGTAMAAPYRYDWSGMAPGTYVLTARATDNAGASTTSAPVTITVSTGLSITYLHPDLLGSPVAATNEAGALLWREHYEPYGQRLVEAQASSANRQFYTGKPLDAETGLSYFGARYYDPRTGRFMGIDSVDASGENTHGFNRYAYANNNPYRFVDPDGRMPFWLFSPLGPGGAGGGGGLEGMRAAEGLGRTPPLTPAQVDAGVPPSVAPSESIGLKLEKLIAAHPFYVALQGLQIWSANVTDSLIFNRSEGDAGAGKAVPDSTVVCRGGSCTPQSFSTGKGVSVDPATGKLDGVSTGLGDSVSSASKNIPHKKVGATTAGDIRAAGGQVVNDHGNHGVVSGLTAEKAAEVFRDVVKNPNQ